MAHDKTTTSSARGFSDGGGRAGGGGAAVAAERGMEATAAEERVAQAGLVAGREAVVMAEVMAVVETGEAGTLAVVTGVAAMHGGGGERVR